MHSTGHTQSDTTIIQPSYALHSNDKRCAGRDRQQPAVLLPVKKKQNIPGIHSNDDDTLGTKPRNRQQPGIPAHCPSQIDDEGRIWQRSAAATGLEVVSGCYGGVRHLARGRRSLAGGRGLRRFHAVRDEVDYDDDDVEMQPRGGRGSGNISNASSGSSSGVVGGRSRYVRAVQ